MKLFFFRHNRLEKTKLLPLVETYYTDITLLLHGHIDYVVNGENVHLQSGDILFCKEGTPLLRKAIQDSEYVSFNVCFEEQDVVFDLPLVIKDGVSKPIRLLLNACDAIYAASADFESSFCLIVQCILTELQKDLKRKNLHPLTIEIMNYVSTHLNEPISLAQVANATFFSSSYCSVIFRKDMNVSIIDYVLMEKIQEAKRLIEEGVPLKQVAEFLSFTDYNYFSRIFKKRVGCSPISYRKQLSESPKLYQQIFYKRPVTKRYFIDAHTQLEEDSGPDKK